MDEYVGPSRFQWTPQLQAINEQLSLLPANLKRSISAPHRMKEPVERKTIAYMKAADPSESVRSADIVPLLRTYFPKVDFKGYGGSLLHEVLYDIAGNFNEQEPGSVECLDRLFRREDDLITQGVLGHDFAVIVATKE